MEEMDSSQRAEKLLFNRVWEGKDQRNGQDILFKDIPPYETSCQSSEGWKNPDYKDFLQVISSMI